MSASKHASLTAAEEIYDAEDVEFLSNSPMMSASRTCTPSICSYNGKVLKNKPAHVVEYVFKTSADERLLQGFLFLTFGTAEHAKEGLRKNAIGAYCELCDNANKINYHHTKR